MPIEMQGRIIMLGYWLWTWCKGDQRFCWVNLLSMVAAPLGSVFIAVPSTQCLTTMRCVFLLTLVI